MKNFKSIDEIFELQNEFFNIQVTKNIDFRIKQLDTLKTAIEEYEGKIIEAINMDFDKCEFEAYETEVGITLSEIKHVRNKIKKWASPQKVKTPLTNPGAKTYIYKQPYGVCLIMSPWNYPFYLCISPLIGAIIGGNCAVIKPSELSLNTSKVIKEMIEKYFDKKYIAVIEGEIEENKYLLSKDFDYIFFTGSPAVGKIVMETASKNLTPCTLELGGKSPCIVDKNCDLDLSAKKIVWGKILNGGQTCIAPDYIIAHKDIKNKLIENMKKYIVNFYGDDPIIPVLEFQTTDDIVKVVNANKNPLALYLFTKDKNFEEDILNRISFGGGCVNDTIMHISNHNAPFGGIGNSGIGSYHGKRSFDAFTHEKTVLKASMIDIPFKYPPYTKKGLNLLKKSFEML